MTMLDHLRSLSAAVLLVGCAIPAAQAQRAGSIYDPDHGPAGLIAEKTAYRKGDILTVVISETQLVSNNESSDLARATNLNYKINVFDIKPNALQAPLPAIDADSSDNFNGSAKYEKSGAFTAVGSTSVPAPNFFMDLAFDARGTMYGASMSGLFTIDLEAQSVVAGQLSRRRGLVVRDGRTHLRQLRRLAGWRALPDDRGRVAQCRVRASPGRVQLVARTRESCCHPVAIARRRTQWAVLWSRSVGEGSQPSVAESRSRIGDQPAMAAPLMVG